VVFKVGDLVRLQSGGPSMTVESILSSNPGSPTATLMAQLKLQGFEEGSVACKWYDETSKSFKKDYFKPAMLKSAE
jgi:uncharacterized protein YodC (DUF2158 family)